MRTLGELKRVITDKLGIDVRGAHEIDLLMVLHLVQPPGQVQSRKKTAQKDTSRKGSETSYKG